MMTFLKHNQNPSVPHSSNTTLNYKSFEDVYKNSYSHGLEAIYTLESIDLKTVRRIGDSFPSQDSQNDFKHDFLADNNAQLEFDFGPGFREWMKSFILQEPIQVLHLSRHAEKSLNDQGIKTLLDLSKADSSKWVYIKGMGQGHIDEIQQKLASYTEGRPLEKCSYVDFSSWLKSILGAFSYKKVFVFLEPFKLEHIFKLSTTESVEVRKLPLEKRLEWRQEIECELSLNKELLFADFRNVVDTFIKPWLLRRQGFATKEELIERLIRVSNTPMLAHKAIDFLSMTYFEGRFPLEDYLVYSMDQIFFVAFEDYLQYEGVITLAKSYFYNGHVSYDLNELMILLMREFAKSWQNLSLEFIEKALRFCPAFRVRKAESGNLKIRLS